MISVILLPLVTQVHPCYACYRLVTAAHQHLFSVVDKLNVSAEPRLQIAYVHGTHESILDYMTMLVISETEATDNLQMEANRSLPRASFSGYKCS
jgi:hypothetical protein